jgi:hypothetical protein
MEQTSSQKGTSCTASQNIPCILLYPMVYYNVHSSLSIFTLMSLINPVYALPSYFF